jgi:tetratricopeptide (TPR) repeat protein
MRASAPAESVQHLSRAVALAGPSSTERRDLLLSLGEACLLSGQLEDAERAFDQARRSFDPDDGLRLGRALHGVGRTQWRRERLQESRDSLGRAAELLEADPGVELVSALLDLASRRRQPARE